MLNKELRGKYNLPTDFGAMVVRDHTPGSVAIVKDSPAEKAGVKENDVILELNGEKLTEQSDFSDTLQKCKVGEEVELTILRKDKHLKLKTMLEERK